MASASSPSSVPGREGDLQEKLPDLSRTLAERILGRSLSDEGAARSTTESYVRSLNSSESSGSSGTAASSSSDGSGSTTVGAGSSGSSGSTATETREG